MSSDPFASRGPIRLGIPMCLWLVLSGCGHTTDARLEELFHAHEEEFDHLLSMLQADTETKTIIGSKFLFGTRDDRTSNETDRQHLSEARWNEYQKLFHDLGLDGASGAAGGTVYFRVDSPSLVKGGSDKGFVYSEHALDPVLTRLDGYTISANNGTNGSDVAYKLIKPGWYLYISY